MKAQQRQMEVLQDTIATIGQSMAAQTEALVKLTMSIAKLDGQQKQAAPPAPAQEDP